MRDTCPVCGLGFRLSRIHDRCFEAERQRRIVAQAIGEAHRRMAEDARKVRKGSRHAP